MNAERLTVFGIIDNLRDEALVLDKSGEVRGGGGVSYAIVLRYHGRSRAV